MSSKPGTDGKPEIAVALRYDAEVAVPTVIAKGRGYVAQEIIARAEEAGVAVERDAALATSLARLELQQSIPPELYKAVAQVISYLMRKGLIRKVTERSSSSLLRE